MDRGAWWTAVMGSQRDGYEWATNMFTLFCSSLSPGLTGFPVSHRGTRKCLRWVRYKAVSWESFKKENKVKQNPLAYGSRTWQKMASLLNMLALMRNPDALSLFFFFSRIYLKVLSLHGAFQICAFLFSMGWLLSTLIFSSLWTYRLNSKLRNWYRASYFYTLRLNHCQGGILFTLSPPATSSQHQGESSRQMHSVIDRFGGQRKY